MSKLGKVTWKKFREERKEDLKEHLDSFAQIIREYLPNWRIEKASNEFTSISKDLDESIKNAHEKYLKLPLAVAYYSWVSTLETTLSIEEARHLLKNGFIGIRYSGRSSWTLAHARTHDANEIYQAIRCCTDLKIEVREKLVRAYQSFLKYLFIHTKGYIPFTPDEEEKSQRDKNISLANFYTFISHLDLRMMCIAKLLYFGTVLTIHDILNIDMKHVLYEKQEIKFDFGAVKFPCHVLADIQALVGERTTGKIFLGRNKKQLSHTTIFRNFKEGGRKSGIKNNLTPSRLKDENKDICL